MNKWIIISFLTIILPTCMMAQSTETEKTSFAVLGGVNFQNITGDDVVGDKISSSGIIGFHGGVRAMIPIAPEFYFQPGLLFSTKGSKDKSDLGTTSINLSYIEVPLNLVYKSKLGTGSIYVGFGPYVGYGIKGSTKFESSVGTLKSDVKFQNKVTAADPLTSTYIKPLDVGGNLLVGYQMSGGLFLQLNTQLGLVNINPDDTRIPNNKTSLKNVGYGLSLGYSF